MNKAIIEMLGNKFIEYLEYNKIDCEDEDEACCIFEQLVGEAIERQK